MRVVVPGHRAALGLEPPVLPGKPLPNPVVRARELRAALERHGTAAGVARACGVARASACQYLTLLRRLPAEVLEAGEVEKEPVEVRQLPLRRMLAEAQAGEDGRRWLSVRRATGQSFHPWSGGQQSPACRRIQAQPWPT